MFDKQFKYNEITNTWTVNLKPRYDHALPDDDEMDEDDNQIIKNTGDINIDTTTYFQEQTQNITQNGDYIYEQNENGAWHLELKPQDSTEPTDVNINISSPPVEFEQSNITNNGYYLMNKNSTTNKYEPVQSTSSNYNLNVNVTIPKINIKYINNSSSSNNTISISNMNYNSSSTNITIPANNILIMIKPGVYSLSASNIEISIYSTKNNSTTYTVPNETYYYVFPYNYIVLYDENKSRIMYVYTLYPNSVFSTFLSENKFNLILN